MHSVGFLCRRFGITIALCVCLADFLALGASPAGERCLACHPQEVQTYARSSMARALSRPLNQPGGTFEHPYSQTKFRIYEDSSGLHQSLVRRGEKADQRVAYVIGSG